MTVSTKNQRATTLQERSEAAISQEESNATRVGKSIGISVLRRVPGAESWVIPRLRSIRFKMKRREWARNSQRGRQEWASTDHLNNRLRVSPASIEYCANSEFSYAFFKGAVVDGDWDQTDKRFDRLDIYAAFDEVCRRRSCAWEDTEFFKRFDERINSGQDFWECRTSEEFSARCRGLSELYESIETDGYRSQDELATGREDEVSVALSRHGQLLFSDGAHRLSIAKLLNLEEIPVSVTVRHPQWLAFRNELVQFAKEQPSGSLYQPCLHPDLRDIPAAHGCEDRFVAIRDAIPIRSGNLLDIGANTGFFSQRFESEGFKCIASENAEAFIYFLTKLRKAVGGQFEIRTESTLDDEGITEKSFDVVLALNIFHHFLKSEELHSKLTRFLKNLDTRYLILETHMPDEDQMDGAFRNFSPDEFCSFILRNSRLSQSQCIFQADDGRPVYLLS